MRKSPASSLVTRSATEPRHERASVTPETHLQRLPPATVRQRSPNYRALHGVPAAGSRAASDSQAACGSGDVGMSMRWIPYAGTQWAFKSSDGYYAIAPHAAMYEAFHIEALWARPVTLGVCSHFDGAQNLCEQHAARVPAPA
jgi:hypothetical protein